jgi:tetratricopeptide (TPR) repeat protein
MIRVDSPSDLIEIQKNDINYARFGIEPLVQKWTRLGFLPKLVNDPVWKPFPSEGSLDKWKTRGNDFYKRKEYSDAIRAYSAGLEDEKENASLLYLNRSAANLALGLNEAALHDALLHLAEIKGSSDKGIFRVARCLYNLRRFEDALEYSLKIPGGNQDASDLLLKIRARISVCIYS